MLGSSNTWIFSGFIPYSVQDDPTDAERLGQNIKGDFEDPQIPGIFSGWVPYSPEGDP